jgi:ribulose bisphosphate carboxylase small subunit
MGKILKYEELNIKKLEQVLYSETYEVKFSIQKDDGFWTRATEMYHAKRKDEHEYVMNRWKKDYKNKNIKLIGIYYQ